MTLQDAADHLNVTKKRLWRAVKTGQLQAVQIQKGQRWEYRVTADALEAYREILQTEELGWNDQDRVGSANGERHGAIRSAMAQDGTTDSERFGTGPDPEWNVPSRSGTNHPSSGQPPSNIGSGQIHASSPPPEVYIELINRLSRAERRSIELELALRQSQRLLAENAESITQREAVAREAQAQLQVVEDTKQAKIAELTAQLTASELARNEETERRLNVELELTRLSEATPSRPSGFFSWFGFRRKGTSSSQVDKAV